MTFIAIMFVLSLLIVALIFDFVDEVESGLTKEEYLTQELMMDVLYRMRRERPLIVPKERALYVSSGKDH